MNFPSNRSHYWPLPAGCLAMYTLAIMLIVIAVTLSAGAQIAPSQAAAIQYGLDNLPVGLRAQFASWNGAHLNLSIGSSQRFNVGTPVVAGYTESSMVYPDQIAPYVCAVASANGWNCEDLLLHFNQDYFGNGSGWNWPMDAFDVFEMSDCPITRGIYNCGANLISRAVHGAWIYTGSYIDRTATLYTGCGTLCAVPNAGWMYLGYQEPFALVKLTLTRAQSGGSVAFQYWNGSTWSDLTTAPVSGAAQNFADGTSNLATNGTVSWFPPNDWARTQVNGVGNSKYWIRIGPSGAGTAPQIATAKGDNWKSTIGAGCTNCGVHGANNRGWDATNSDGTHVNVGLGNLEYDPNPPRTATAACNNQPCSANFRYQARTVGYGGSNNGSEVYANSNRQIGGIYTWGDVLNYSNTRNGNALLYYYNSVMLDDAGSQPSTIPTFTESLTDFGVGTWAASANYSIARFASLVHAVNPSFQIGLNDAGADPGACFASGVAWCIHELLPTSIYPATPDLITHHTGIGYLGFGSHLQDFAPIYNPNNIKSLWSYNDNEHFGLNPSINGAFTSGHLWDNRRSALNFMAWFLMGYNSNVEMSYYAGYNAQWDYVIEWNTAPSTTLASPLSWDCSQTPKTIVVASDSGFTVVGGLDPQYNTRYAFRIGSDIVLANKTSTNQYTTLGSPQNGSMVAGNSTIPCSAGNYAVGTPVQYASAYHRSDPAFVMPDDSNVAWWTSEFPAMEVNLGVPDVVNGWAPVLGSRGDWDPAFIAQCSLTSCPTTCTTNPCQYNRSDNNLGITSPSSTPGRCTSSKPCDPVWRRSFTQAEVYFRPHYQNGLESDLDNPGVTVPLGTTLYPLLSNGKTGPGVTSINLLSNQAFIGMHSPIN